MRSTIISFLGKFQLLEAARSVKNALMPLSPSAILHKRQMKLFYAQFLKAGDLCFDVGANIGNRTDIFITLGANVVAVEPQEACAAYLEKRYRNKKVTLVKKALGDKEGEAEMTMSRSSTISSLSKDWISTVKNSGRFSDIIWDRTAIVSITTLDKLISQYGLPVFCKIDVEGFESNVLMGLSRPIKNISFEFIPEYIDSTVKCVEHLSSLGKVEFNYTIGEEMHFYMQDWVCPTDMCSILTNMRKDSVTFGDIYARFDQ
ncbi:MAG: FkbM family methyltransferase [Desulfuromonadales bacterium]|nr:FkbM family methyltransferase [Desulfuromonadales bacterium]